MSVGEFFFGTAMFAAGLASVYAIILFLFAVST